MKHIRMNEVPTKSQDSQIIGTLTLKNKKEIDFKQLVIFTIVNNFNSQ
jgi:hypothetical protein